MTINYCKPLIPDFKEVENILRDSISLGRLSNFGPAYDLFVEELSRFLKLPPDKSVVITSSGHTALMTAYHTLGVCRLVVPAYTFESTRVAAELQGITTIPVDVDPTSGCISTEILDKLSVDSFDAVCAVCALSTVPDLESLSSWCRQNNKKLIVDGAATFGTKEIYSFADAFCLSFHATKTLSVGEGGAVILPKDREAPAREYINFGFDSRKNVVRSGINAKVSEYTCAIAIDLLRRCGPELESRQKNLSLYREGVGEYIPESWSAHTIYQALPLFLPTIEKAQAVRQALDARQIQNLQYYRPTVGLPISSELYHRNVSVPIHSGLESASIKEIIDIVKGV